MTRDHKTVKRTLGEYLMLGLMALLMCTTLAGMGIRIYLAFTGG